MFFNLPTRPLYCTAALTERWEENSKNAWNIFPVLSPCYDISDPKWRNNKAINQHNEDQLTLRVRLYFDAELPALLYCRHNCLFWVLICDNCQDEIVDFTLNTWWWGFNIYILKNGKLLEMERLQTMGCVKLSNKIKRIFWSLLPLIKRQDTPHPLKYYDNPLHTLHYIC